MSRSRSIVVILLGLVWLLLLGSAGCYSGGFIDFSGNHHQVGQEDVDG